VEISGGMMHINRRDFIGRAMALSTATILAPGILKALENVADDAPGLPFDEEEISLILARALEKGGDFSEIYYESIHSLSLKLSEGVFSEATVGFSEGTGIRTVDGMKNGYAYLNGFKLPQALEAASTAAFISTLPRKAGVAKAINDRIPQLVTVKLPVGSVSEGRKMQLMEEAEQAARELSPHVKQVDITYFDQTQRRFIVNSDRLRRQNEIPLIWVVVEVLAEKNGVRHQGRARISARQGFEFFDDSSPTAAAREAAREAVEMLDAKTAPGGTMPVVMECGWGGVLMHEAVGHGLEGDFIYKGTSIYADKLGKRVGSDLVTLVDDSSWPNARGTTEFDDEGTPGRRNVLVENGILVGFMHDLISARQLKMTPSGNGRRESFRHYPIPRMTNTFLDNGKTAPADIIADTPRGIYIKSLSGGSVDTISGQFNFIVRESYLIENGKITSPVAGATLIGRGIDVLSNIDAVGNDLKLGVGTCGKEQWVPVTSGQPTARISRGITVGGSA
jgi:TldD protein